MEKLTTKLLTYGAVLLGGYLLWKYIQKNLPRIADPIATPLAKLYEWWTFKPPVNVTGVYVLQDYGTLVDPTTVSVNWVASNDPRAANYDGQLPLINVRGVQYVLGPHDDNGNYPAVRL